MAEWEINKGIGRTVEFKGLKARYLFLFAGGLLAVLLLVVVLYLLGAGQMVCLGFGVVGGCAIAWQTFAMNRRFGEHGLMKRRAVRTMPRYLIHRQLVRHMARRPKCCNHEKSK